MTWTYLASSEDSACLQESEESTLPWTPGCSLAPIVKTARTLPLSWFLIWRGETYRQQESGTMCGHSREQCSEALTSSAGDSHAKTSVALTQMGKAWKDSEAAFIGTSTDSPENSSQLSFSLKTSLRSQPVADLWLSNRLPSSGMIAGGRFCRPAQLEVKPGKIIGGSYWQRPRASEGFSLLQSREAAKNRMRKNQTTKKQQDITTRCLAAAGRPAPMPFIETLMGFRRGWTDFDCLAIAAIPGRQEGHSKC